MCRALAFDVAAAVLLGTRWDSETMSESWQPSVSRLRCPMQVSQRDLGLLVQSVDSHMLSTYTVCVCWCVRMCTNVLSCTVMHDGNAVLFKANLQLCFAQFKSIRINLTNCH